MARVRGATVEDQVREMALRFAEDVTRAVRQGLAAEVTERVSAVLREAGRSGLLRSQLAAGPGDRRIGKPPVPVQCPAPGCENPGIRAKRNFCAEHAAALTEGEKRRLREAQTGRAPAPRRAKKS
jgi:hypothetical protein